MPLSKANIDRPVPEHIDLLLPAAAELRRTARLLDLISAGALIDPTHHQIKGCDDKAEAIIKYLRREGYGDILKGCGIS